MLYIFKQPAIYATILSTFNRIENKYLSDPLKTTVHIEKPHKYNKIFNVNLKF